MSGLEIYAFDKAGEAYSAGDAHNSWGGAMHIWDSLSVKYGFGRFSIFGRSPKIWEACNEDALSDLDTIACKFTFDNVIVAHKNIPRLVEALQAFCAEFVVGKDVAKTLLTAIEILRGIFDKGDATAVAFNQTSVSSSPWYIYGDDDDGRGYNLAIDEGHWELFGDEVQCD